MNTPDLIEYRGLTITPSHYEGCYIRGKYFKPNGTGKATGKLSDEIINKGLRALPSDRYQKKGSHPHDIMYEIGGTEKDRKTADVLMRKIAIYYVLQSHAWYSPLRHIHKANMWRNYFLVRKLGKETFNYTDEPPTLSLTLE
jgi:hypothetical protein